MAPISTSITVRLVEPVVFLNGSATPHDSRRRRQHGHGQGAQAGNGQGHNGPSSGTATPPMSSYVYRQPGVGGSRLTTSPSPAAQQRISSFASGGPSGFSSTAERDGSTERSRRDDSRSRSRSRGRAMSPRIVEEEEEEDQDQADDQPPPAILRGLLTFTLAKPSRIKRIGVKVRGEAKTEWPEGIGTRRLEVMEQHILIDETVNFFSAAESSTTDRRAASMGPGFRDSSMRGDEYVRSGRGLIRASSVMPTRETSTDRAFHPSRDSRFDHSYRSVSPPPFRPSAPSRSHNAPAPIQEVTTPLAGSSGINTPIPSTSTPPASDTPTIHQSSHDDPYPAPSRSLSQYDDDVPDTTSTVDDDERLASRRGSSADTLGRLPRRERPPYDFHLQLNAGNADPPEPSPPPRSSRPPAFRSVSNESAESAQIPGSAQSTSSHSDASSTRSIHYERTGGPRSLRSLDSDEVQDPTAPTGYSSAPVPSSERSSFERGRQPKRQEPNASMLGAPPIYQTPESQQQRVHQVYHANTVPSSINSAVAAHHAPDHLSQVDSLRIQARAETSPSQARNGSKTRSSESKTRFSLAGISDALKGKVKRRAQSPDAHARGEEGAGGRSVSRGRSTGLKALRDALVHGGSHTGGDSDEEEGGKNVGWKEFKAGSYTYPISIPIPSTLPPTLHCEFGQVVYTIKGFVYRAGALTSNLTSEVEINLVACPGEDNLEETESIVVERFWETQMRYMVALSGKSFPIGGTIPINFRINPLSKCKIFRISAHLEEKISYYAHDRRISRQEPVKKYQLLKVENEGLLEPILPLESGSPDAIAESPLAALFINPNSSDDSTPFCLDPLGPWNLETQLHLPDCASKIHFSCSHKTANIGVQHWLKIVMRVERGDDEMVDAKGKRKRFDIIIECPVHILSCRCSSNILPPYTPTSSSFATSRPTAGRSTNPHCRCEIERRHPASVGSARPPETLTAAERGVAQSLLASVADSQARARLTTTAASSSTTEPADYLEQNLQFARLISGEVTQTGEAPPAYDVVVSVPEAGRSGSTSRSRAMTTVEVEGEDGRRGRSDSTSRGRGRARAVVP